MQFLFFLGLMIALGVGILSARKKMLEMAHEKEEARQFKRDPEGWERQQRMKAIRQNASRQYVGRAAGMGAKAGFGILKYLLSKK